MKDSFLPVDQSPMDTMVDENGDVIANGDTVFPRRSLKLNAELLGIDHPFATEPGIPAEARAAIDAHRARNPSTSTPEERARRSRQLATRAIVLGNG